MKEAYLYIMLEDTKDLVERIEIIKTAPYDAYTVVQPGGLVDLFEVKTWPDALKVAQAFALRFKPDMIDREESSMYKKSMTILDYLDHAYECNGEKYIKLLIDAFNWAGFKRAKDCDEKVLLKDYYSNKAYSKHPADLQKKVNKSNTRKRKR